MRDTLSRRAHGIQQSNNRPVTVVSSGTKQVPDQEIKSESKQESVTHSEDKPSTSHSQAVPSDRTNEVPDRGEKATPLQKSETYHTAERPGVTQTTTGKPAVQHIPLETPTVQHIPLEKPPVQHIPVETSTVPYIPTEKLTFQHNPAGQPSVQHSPTEIPGFPHASTENPSSQGSQASHVSDLRKDKLEVSVTEKVAEMLSHSEQTESVDMKAEASRVASKVQEGGTVHDTYLKQQQKEVEWSQKAQTTAGEPGSTVRSAGIIAEEVPVVADKSTTRKNDSRTSAARYRKVKYYLCLLLTSV
jgi:hypothetical protein